MVTESHAMRYTLCMPSLREIAQNTGINIEKPFFPVNSLRLLYYIIADHYTSENAEVREQVGSLIPKVEAIFAARTQHRKSDTTTTTKTDWESIQAPLQDVYRIIDTPKIRQVFESYFSYTLPLQDDLFLHLYTLMYGDQKVDKYTLRLLLRVRSMDSIVFSTLVAEILAKHSGKDDASLALTLHYHLQLAYQLNDLVDAIVFAKDDLEAKNFSPFEMIRRVAPEAQTAKELIKGLLEDFLQKTDQFVFPEALNTQVTEFYTLLAGVVLDQ
jgi:hypothetical protein